LVKHLEDDNEEYKKLVTMVEKDWNEIEDKIKPKRKRRFG